jgi:hypothetical protein
VLSIILSRRIKSTIKDFVASITLLYDTYSLSLEGPRSTGLIPDTLDRAVAHGLMDRLCTLGERLRETAPAHTHQRKG